MGTTYAVFQSSGTSPKAIDRLKIKYSAFAILLLPSFRILPYTPSGYAALFGSISSSKDLISFNSISNAVHLFISCMKELLVFKLLSNLSTKEALKILIGPIFLSLLLDL